MVNSASHSDYSEKDVNGFDTDIVNATSGSLYINGNKTVGVYVHAATGAHATHVITVQISANNIDWFDSTSTITGTGFVEFDTIAQYVRIKVTIAEGAVSTCNIKIASK